MKCKLFSGTKLGIGQVANTEQAQALAQAQNSLQLVLKVVKDGEVSEMEGPDGDLSAQCFYVLVTIREVKGHA